MGKKKFMKGKFEEKITVTHKLSYPKAIPLINFDTVNTSQTFLLVYAEKVDVPLP